MSMLTRTAVLWVTSIMIAWPILDGCWRGFLGDPGWRNDAVLHSVTISLGAGLFFVLPVVIQRLKPSPH